MWPENWQGCESLDEARYEDCTRRQLCGQERCQTRGAEQTGAVGGGGDHAFIWSVGNSASSMTWEAFQ